jgi:hypothetical protein
VPNGGRKIKMNLRTILLGLFLAAIFLCGVWVIILNYYWWLYVGFVRKEHHSPIPLLGGLLCFLVLHNLRIFGVHFWAWLPWILDPGCVFLLGLFVYTAIVSRGFKRGV